MESNPPKKNLYKKKNIFRHDIFLLKNKIFLDQRTFRRLNVKSHRGKRHREPGNRFFKR